MNTVNHTPDSFINVSFRQWVDNVKCTAYKDELAIIELEGPSKEIATPVRTEALMICICVGGRATVKIDLKEYEIERQTMFPLSHKNYLTILRTSEDFKAVVIMTSLQIFESLLPKLTELLPLMINFPAVPITVLSDEEYRRLLDYVALLEAKIRMDDSPFKQQKLCSLLQTLNFEMLEIQHSRTNGMSFKKSRKEELMARFILLVSDQFRHHRDVTYYANELCITPKHLSAVVKEITGRPAGEWIDQYVIMEAKVLLRTTDYSIQQVASSLNFANQSFFGKYFKHVTGISPTTYRNSVT